MDDIEIRVTIAGQRQEVIEEGLSLILQLYQQNERENRIDPPREWQVSGILAGFREELRKLVKKISSSQRQEKGEEE